AFFVALTLSVSANAQSDHDRNDDHSHSADFGTIDDGWIALENVSAHIRAAVKAGNMGALHGLSDELLAVTDGLASYEDDVPQSNQLRFTSSINQLRSLSKRLHSAHDRNDVAAAERLVPQLNGMVQLLMVSAEGQLGY
ncbi:MAG: hypothetical protein HN793_08280, partial [Rhodospirillaceae bacterium]|nr:hypothetical protein [Rhodospirillaceae bacterium]